MGRFIDREERLAARQLEADQERDERDEHRDAGPKQIEEIDRGNLARRIWRDKRPNDARSRAQRDQTEDRRELPMHPGCRAVAALVRNLERPSERLNDSAEKRGSNGK